MEINNPHADLIDIWAELNISAVVLIKAKELIDCGIDPEMNAYGINLLSGKSSTGLAAGAIYAATLLTNEKITQEEIAEVAEISEVTIRKRYQEFLFVFGIYNKDPDPSLYDRLQKLADEEHDEYFEKLKKEGRGQGISW